MARLKPTFSTIAAPEQAASACPCAWAGCAAPGVYRAPKDRSLSDYVMYCLDHVRTFNATWDFHIHMTPADIEAEIRRMVTWDRPTWPLGSNGTGPSVKKARAWSTADIRDPMNLGGGTAFDPKLKKTARQNSWEADQGLRPDERKALRILDLEGPLTMADLKRRYKELVKQHHPDTHGGSTEAENRMKMINSAYQLLSAALRRVTSA